MQVEWFGFDNLLFVTFLAAGHERVCSTTDSY